MQALPARRAARGATEMIMFTVPTMSFTEWCNELRRQRITPVVNVHFREVDKKLYRNINFNSFTVNDSEEEWRDQETLWPIGPWLMRITSPFVMKKAMPCSCQPKMS
jgi:hypothetical protein